MAGTKLDARQTVLRTALSMVGSAAGDSVDTIYSKIDAELAKHFEDRNVILTDGGTITFTGTQLQLTENLNLVLNQKISGASPQIISLALSTVNFTATGQMWYVVIDRSAGTATSTTAATSMPAATSANQEVFLIAKRIDAADGTQRLYFRNGTALNAGQTVRLGASGSGSGGSGTGDDLDSLAYRASFTDSFTESSTNSNSSVNATGTNAIFNAAKNMYVMSYDAGKTVTTVGTAATLSATPAYTVAVGDVVVSGSAARKITALASQTSYTLEAAFPSNLTGAACCVSQALYTKDIYNFAVDGSALSAAFGATTFSDILVDYKDSTTAGSNIFVPNTAPVVAFTASNDNSTFTSVGSRATNETDTQSNTTLAASGTALYLRFFALQSSGSGTVNLIMYKAFMQKVITSPTGGVQFAAYGMTNNSTTSVGCTISVAGGKTTITLTGGNVYAMGVNTGQTYGSCDVLVNGQLLPRFVSGTVPTTDSYYTEVSPTVIQLDKDYSSLQLEVQILVRAQVIDASTTNTSAIAAIGTHQFNNRLINGAFDFWQRGTSVTVANGTSAYQADRWYAKNSLGTSGVLTFSQVTGVLVGSKFGAQVQITTAPTVSQANGTELYQVIENLNTLDLLGQPISFGANIKALGNVTSVGLQFCYATSEIKPTLFFGSEQSVTVNTSGFTLGQLIAQNSGTLPTSSGVIGVRIRVLGVSSGNTYDLNNGFIVEQAMVGVGAVLPTFARSGRNTQVELAECQRYYEKSYDVTTAPQTNTTTGLVGGGITAAGTNNFYSTVYFKSTKRTSGGTINLYGKGGTLGQFYNGTADNNSISLNFSGSSAFNTINSVTAASSVFFHYTCDAEI